MLRKRTLRAVGKFRIRKMLLYHSYAPFFAGPLTEHIWQHQERRFPRERLRHDHVHHFLWGGDRSGIKLVHTRTFAFTYSDTHTHAETRTRRNTHTQKHTHTHADTRTQKHAHADTHTRYFIFSSINARPPLVINVICSLCLCVIAGDPSKRQRKRGGVARRPAEPGYGVTAWHHQRCISCH